MKSNPEKMLKKHQSLIQSDGRKVVSHTQRMEGDWQLNTLMIEGVDTAFKYKRKENYKNLTGARVNLTYYRDTENIAGITFEVMRVVRVKIS